ncbi:MAG: VOC family protein [Chthonomonas sp.]|nr:VOC family protein [Chthonomonas sp.]
MQSLGVAHHIGLTVPDLEAAITWYCDRLGFGDVRRVAVGTLEIVLISHPGGAIIELFGTPDARRTEPEHCDVGASLPYEGWRHFALETADIEAAVAEARANGIEVISEITPVPPFGYRYVFFRDPFGNLIELVQKG